MGDIPPCPALSGVVFLMQRALCVLQNKPIVMKRLQSEIHESSFFLKKLALDSADLSPPPTCVAFITVTLLPLRHLSSVLYLLLADHCWLLLLQKSLLFQCVPSPSALPGSQMALSASQMLNSDFHRSMLQHTLPLAGSSQT